MKYFHDFQIIFLSQVNLDILKFNRGDPKLFKELFIAAGVLDALRLIHFASDENVIKWIQPGDLIKTVYLLHLKHIILIDLLFFIHHSDKRNHKFPTTKCCKKSKVFSTESQANYNQ
jgi:hypothetical protein